MFIVLCFNVAGPVSAAVPRQAAQPATITEVAYWQKLAASRETIAGLEGTPPAAAQAQLAILADDWATVTAIEGSDGGRRPLDTRYLLAQLRAEPPALDELLALFDSLLAAQTAWPEPPAPPETAVDRLAGILSQSEFQWTEERGPSFLDRLLADLWLRFSQLLGRANVRLTPNLLIGLALVVIVGVLAYMLREALGGLISEAETAVPAHHSDEPLTADAALKRAGKVAGDGDYRTAVRYLYLSTLLLLDERGLLQYDRSRTNREYLRSLNQQPELASILQGVVDVFDRVWYGYQPLSDAAYAQFVAQVEQLRRQPRSDR